MLENLIYIFGSKGHSSSSSIIVWQYWQSNMNNVKMFQAHKEPIRKVSFR